MPDVVPRGASAGMTVLVTLPADLDEVDIETRALEVGVRVYPLRDFRASRRSDPTPGLALGYGQLTPAQLDQGAHQLAEVIAAARR